jgi:hypothetical protein
MAEENKKSIIEEALNEIAQLQEAMKGNTEEILRSVAREEISGTVNESLHEDELDNEEDFSTDAEGGDELDIDTPSADAEEEEVESSEEFGSEEEGEDLSTELGSEEAVDDFSSVEDSEESYGEEEGTDMEYDFTNSSDEDIISVFKKLSGEDEIEVIDDNEVHITDPESGSEYHIKMNSPEATASEEEIEAPMADMDMTPEVGPEEEEVAGDEEVEYEIDLGGDEEETEEEEVEEGVNEDIVRGAGHDEYLKDASMESGDIEGTKAPVDTDLGDNLTGGFDDDAVKHANAEGPMVMEDEAEEIEESEELDESIPVGNAEGRRVPGKNTPIKGAGAKSLQESEEYKKLKNEYSALVKENQEFKKALKQFRGLLSEVGKYNTNLTYATKIFTEHSTTKEEKRNILKRFDEEATSLKESKKVYKSIVEGLKSKPTMNESVSKKLSDDALTTSHSQINESTAYQAETSRIQELMRKVANR